MRLRHLPAFLPTRRAPAFSKAEYRPARGNGLNPLHLSALRELHAPAAAAGFHRMFRWLAPRPGRVFVPQVGEKFP